ncbi:MAG TPA: phosphate ABC transporter permease subunit PstC, partial [Acidimicrobiia bacterium]
FRHAGIGFVTKDNWDPNNNHFGALSLIYGTVVSSIIALVIAVPVSIGIALFVTEMAPAGVARVVTVIIDLLAAIPSVVFGLWAILSLALTVQGPYKNLSDITKSIPILHSLFKGPVQGASIMTAGIVLAIMIVPIISSLARAALATVPESDRAAALALGSTRWEAIRVAVLPKVKGGLWGASMLGLGRALGETIAVALIIGQSTHVSADLLHPGATMASTIALEWQEAGGEHASALIALGVVLFVITIIVNSIARAITRRSEARLAA